MNPLAYLKELTPHIYANDLNPAQRTTAIIDMATQLGFSYTTHGNVRTEFIIQQPAGVNVREPYMVLYNNAARTLCNNGHLLVNKYITEVWDEELEFECGFRKPSDAWYKARHRERVQIPIQAVEIHQESINTDCADLEAVKKCLNLWYKVINYDWDGKLIDGSING
jgi:hypothetical protein